MDVQRKLNIRHLFGLQTLFLQSSRQNKTLAVNMCMNYQEVEKIVVVLANQ